ncbi:uncharacterized protein V6R79_014300 [Siganus canaliculatus]
MFILIWTTLLFSVRGSDGKDQTQATTGGFQTTMTLTDPGPCSGSHPEIVCIWTDNQTSADPKHNLTLNLSVEHHGTSSTCSYRCANSANTGKPQNVPCPVCTSAGGALLSNAPDESDNSTATGKNQTLEINTLEDFFTMLLDNVKQPQVIIAFCTGFILSAFICCLTRTCHRKKTKTSENMVETLEMVSTQALPLMDGGQSLENDGAPAEGAEGAEAAAKEVEYSDIDHYRLSRKNPGEAEDDVQRTAETEYAEIKREAAEQRQEDGEQEDGEQEDGEQEGEAVEGEEAKEAEGDEEEQQVVEEQLPVFEDHEATGE